MKRRSKDISLTFLSPAFNTQHNTTFFRRLRRSALSRPLFFEKSAPKHAPVRGTRDAQRMRWRRFEGVAIQRRDSEIVVDCLDRKTSLVFRRVGSKRFYELESRENNTCSVSHLSIREKKKKERRMSKNKTTSSSSSSSSSSDVHDLGMEEEFEDPLFEISLKIKFSEAGEYALRCHDTMGNVSERVIIILPRGKAFHASIFVSLVIPPVVFVGASAALSEGVSGLNPHTASILRGSVALVEGQNTGLVFSSQLKSNRDQRLLFWMSIFRLVSFRMRLYRLYHNSQFRATLEDRTLFSKAHRNGSISIPGVGIDVFEAPSVYEIELSLLPNNRVIRSSIIHTFECDHSLSFRRSTE